jgi:hypothetical protein
VADSAKPPIDLRRGCPEVNRCLLEGDPPDVGGVPDANYSGRELSPRSVEDTRAQAVCIGLAGGGMAIGVMEAFTSDWSWGRKVTVAVIVAVIAAALFHALLTRGGRPTSTV